MYAPSKLLAADILSNNFHFGVVCVFLSIIAIAVGRTDDLIFGSITTSDKSVSAIISYPGWQVMPLAASPVLGLCSIWMIGSIIFQSIIYGNQAGLAVRI